MSPSASRGLSTSAASHHAETCNVVIFGETGAGKSSLINLVARTQTALTSGDGLGCTTKSNGYDALIQNETLKVKLFDTVGLGEGSEGTVPDNEARRVLKKLLQDFMKKTDIHLLIYCVRGVRVRRALRRDYEFIRSEVKERVPIVLVATALEDQEPEMEEWWRNNERSISDLGMTFAGHACVTALAIDENAEDSLKQRHEQSYHAICQLIEQCRLSKGTIRQVPTKPAPSRNNVVLTGETVASDDSLANVRQVVASFPDPQRRQIVNPDNETPKAPATTEPEKSNLRTKECPTIPQMGAGNKHKNIVVFGETSAGKSSLVNLMAETDVAYTSPDMQRCTLKWQEHLISFGGDSYTVFDTVGLEEPQLGVREYLEAVENAYRLIKHLDRQGGIDLLLFCVRAGRVTATLQSNYRLFHEFLCEKKVPIVLAITNLEREVGMEGMEGWWVRNEKTFKKYKIDVAGHACITAANRLDGRHKDLYEHSRTTIRKLIKEHSAIDQKQARIGGGNLFVSSMRQLQKSLVGNRGKSRKDLALRLVKQCGVSREVAIQLTDMIKQNE